jgi:hypothetical protein
VYVYVDEDRARRENFKINGMMGIKDTRNNINFPALPYLLIFIPILYRKANDRKEDGQVIVVVMIEAFAWGRQLCGSNFRVLQLILIILRCKFLSHPC